MNGGLDGNEPQQSAGYTRVRQASDTGNIYGKDKHGQYKPHLERLFVYCFVFFSDCT